MNFSYTVNPNLKKKNFLTGWSGGDARVSEFFFTKNPNLKKNNMGGGGGRVRQGVDGWTEEQAQTNLPL